MDLKKFIEKIKFKLSLKTKRISKLFAPIEKHIKIYANTTKILNWFIDNSFNIVNFTI